MEDIDTARKIVENFILEMNTWEKESEIIENDENDSLDWRQKDALIKENVAIIINKYCTPKKRLMSNPHSISRGLEGTYTYDPNEEKVVDAKIEKPNRICVFTYKEERYYCCYVLLRKANEWLIDSKKSRFYEDEKWDNSYL